MVFIFINLMMFKISSVAFSRASFFFKSTSFAFEAIFEAKKVLIIIRMIMINPDKKDIPMKLYISQIPTISLIGVKIKENIWYAKLDNT